MSPEYFPPPHLVYDDDGRVKRSEAENAVNNSYAPGDDTLKMVAQLGLCILEEENMVVPSKLKVSRKASIWRARPDLTIYFGVEFRCLQVPISPALFPQVQVRLYNIFLERFGRQPVLWRDGIRVALRNSNAEGLLEVQRDQMAVDIIVRGSSMLARDAHMLLELLKEQVLYVAEEFSPGSDMSLKILSSAELRTLAETGSVEPPTVTYEEEDVQDAMERPGRPICPRQGHGEPEDPYLLMAFPRTHVLLMTPENRERFCCAMAITGDAHKPHCLWQELALQLGMPQELVLTMTDPNPACTETILDWWSHRSAGNTVERLLQAVAAVQDQRAVSILEEELDLMKTATLDACQSVHSILNSTVPRVTETLSDASREHVTAKLPMDNGDDLLAATARTPHASANADSHYLPTHTSITPGMRKDTTSPSSEQTRKAASSDDCQQPRGVGSDQPYFTMHAKTVPLTRRTSLPENEEPPRIHLKGSVIELTTFPPPMTRADANFSSRHAASGVKPFFQSQSSVSTGEGTHVEIQVSPHTGTSTIRLREIRLREAVDAEVAVSKDMHAASTPSEATLMDIARRFASPFVCTQLAVYLQLSQGADIVPLLQSGNPHISASNLAFEIMTIWVAENGSAATGNALFLVLKEKLKMVAVAEDFARVLCEPSQL